MAPIAIPIWALLASTVGPALLNLLGGGKDEDEPEQTQETTTEEQPRGYQDPFLMLKDLQMWDTLSRGMGSMSGAGYPGGQGFGSPFAGDFSSLIGMAIPQALAQYQGSMAGGMNPTSRGSYTGPKPTGKMAGHGRGVFEEEEETAPKYGNLTTKSKIPSIRRGGTPIKHGSSRR